MSYTINSSIKAKFYGKSRNINTITAIVIHYTANSGTSATAKANANYFATTTREASAHYIVDEYSTIYQCVPDNYIAWSVGDSGVGTLKNIVTNDNSISIEMVSHSNSNGYYIPDSTINRTIELIQDLKYKYPSISRVCRHYDVTGKLCPATHCKTEIGESNWQTFLQKLNNTVSVIEMPCEGIGVVNEEKINVRSGPGEIYPITGGLIKNDIVNISTKTTNGYYKTPIGYVVCAYLKFQNHYELTSINDIVWELAYRNILSDKTFWKKKLEKDINAYWLARKACNNTINSPIRKHLNSPDTVLWELCDARKLITDKTLWNKKFHSNDNTYYLGQNIANLTENK